MKNGMAVVMQISYFNTFGLFSESNEVLGIATKHC